MLDIPLVVKRRLSSGLAINVGRLAEDSNGTYFQYDESYLSQHTSLSPFKLATDMQLQAGPRTPHYGLHGVFGDSLPDGWGLYLMDRIFRQHGFNPRSVTALERLAFVGSNSHGALFYEPEISVGKETQQHDVKLQTLGKEAIKEFEGTESTLIEHLMQAGGFGGARPKLNITQRADGTFTTQPKALGKKLLVKLTSEKFELKHSESLVEYTYMTLAKKAGIEVPDFSLLDAGEGRFWLQQSRFDCVGEQGRLHMISACGLLDAPFREPSLDYVELIKATAVMCNVGEARKLLRRAIFNYLAVNQDDHSKNFAFLANDQDQWTLSPFYDVVYSPSPYAEHMTSFNGNGRHITSAAMALMAGNAGLAGVKNVKEMAEEVYSAVREFSLEAKHVGIPTLLTREIQKDIDSKWAAFRSE